MHPLSPNARRWTVTFRRVKDGPALRPGWATVATGTTGHVRQGKDTMSFKPTPTDLWESRFGTEPPFSLGVEEELLLVDPDNQLADQSARIVREANPAQGDVDRELFKAMVESRSEISANVRQAIAALREIRRELVDSGIRIMGVGAHPAALPGE